MVSLDTLATSRPQRTIHAQPPKTPGDHVLAKALGSLGVENHQAWAWANYKRVCQGLCNALSARQIVEIGGGRDPLFSRDEIAALGVAMTVNDISPVELAVLADGYRTACFDVAGDISNAKHLRNTFDLAFSRMVFEHVEDGQRAWSNLHQMLAPGGVALAFVPTLYAVPFVLNWLLPDRLAAAIVKLMFSNRTDDEDPVFPARYSWCFAGEARMRSMLSPIGYREIVIVPFYGHDYYAGIPIVRDVHRWFTGLARRNDWRVFASYAYIAARK
jgi:SAM-dependent methyltransferase